MSAFHKKPFGMNEKPECSASLKEQLSNIMDFGPTNPVLLRDPLADRLRKLKKAIDELHVRVDRLTQR